MKKLFTFLAVLFFALQINGQCWNKIDSGNSHTLAIANNGTLWAWGKNVTGEIGDGTYTDKFVPTQIGTDTNWSIISAGRYFSLAIKTNGTLWGWGLNSSGQLGDGTVTSHNVPVQIGTASNWIAISAGNNFALALRAVGVSNSLQLWAWGDNSFGQLGDGTTINKITPTQIGSNTSWSAISAGQNYTLAIQDTSQFTEVRTLWAWGINSYGQLGNTTTTNSSIPIKIGAATNWSDVVAGYGSSIGLKSNGTLWAWGNNFSGQLGIGSTTDVHTPTQIGTDTNWSNDISVGDSFSLAVKTDGAPWCWGINGSGQLGLGNTNSPKVSPLPMVAETILGGSITSGVDFSAVIKTDGSLYTWGTGLNGELGNGATNTNTSSPAAVACPTTLSINDNLVNNAAFSIYPNPTADFINLQTPTSTTISSLKIIDLLGKTILEQKENNTKINIQKLSKGIYIIQANIENKNYQQKFIKN